MLDRLFQYAVLRHPTGEQAKQGGKTEVVISPTDFFLAANEEEAHMRAVKAIPDDMMNEAGRLEVAVRPF